MTEAKSGSNHQSSRQQKKSAETKEPSKIVEESVEKGAKEKVQESMDKIKEAVRAQEMIHVNIGYITSLYSSSPNHQKIPVGQMMASIIPAIKNKQFKLFFQGVQPIGFVSWAKVSKEVSQKCHDGDYFIKPDEWNGGEECWLIDFIVPHAKEHVDEVIRNLKEKDFSNKDLHMKVRNREGKVQKVVKNFEGWVFGDGSKK